MLKLLPIFLIGFFLHQEVQAQCNPAFDTTINVATLQVQAADTTPNKFHIWYFGDGAQGWGVHASHTYSSPGTYIVKHIIGDSLNTCYDSSVRTVYIGFAVSCNASFVAIKDSINPANYYIYSNSTISGGSIQSYNWTVNGSTVSTASGFGTILPYGVNTVCLTIQTTLGCTSTTCDSILVDSNTHCTITPSFSATPTPGNTTQITFNPNPSGPTWTYAWNFGDGQGASSQSPVHQYSSPGRYLVTLFVSDSNGHCTGSRWDSVLVRAPGADSCRASFVYIKDSINPANYYIYSNSIISGGSIQSYNWTVNGSTVSTASGFGTILPYGVNWVCLTIQTTLGCTSTTCDSILVDSSSHCNLTPSFTATPSAGNPKYITFHPNPSVPTYTYAWNFGDGHLSSSQSPAHLYSSPGRYLVTLFVSDTIGHCSGSYWDSVLVKAPPVDSCRASFVAIKDSSNPSYYLIYSTSTTSGGSIQSYSWNIDGSIVSTAYGFNWPLSPGRHLVCLTIQTTLGCIATTCDSVLVDSNHCNLIASFTVTHSAGNPQQISFYPNPSGPAWTYSWNFGDGQVSSSQSPVHLYSSPGRYLVTLLVSDTIGHCADNFWDSVLVQAPLVDSGARLTSYPSPAYSGNVTIQLGLEQTEKVKLTVFNSYGHAVYTIERAYTAGSNSIGIPVDKLQRGVYYIDIQYGNTRKRSVFQKL